MSTLTTGRRDVPLPLMRPEEVKGFVGHQGAKRPDRTFFVLEKNAPGGDRVWEFDGYCLKDGTTGREAWVIHLICPRCDRALTVKSEKKAIEVAPDRPGLQVEPFECSWPSLHAKSAASALCGWRGGLALPRNEDRVINAIVDGVRRRVHIDAVIRAA